MKKSRVSEEKQVNIFIIGFIVFLVLVICFVVFMVYHSKNKPEENLNDTSVSVTHSFSKRKDESSSEKSTLQQSTQTGTSEKATKSANDESMAETDSTSHANIDSKAENERYQKECDEINKKYDDIISTNDAVIRLLEQSQADDKEKLDQKQMELDIMKASGASENSIESKETEIEILRDRIENGEKDIEKRNKELEKVKADKAAALAEAEKKHQTNLK